ncbi:LOG family protein [Nocardia salmonicida]|uniref:LOG family protein n=1 Tax=Nocardia salmonicida TaxID=53431 RepID=UPI0037A31377
MGSISIAVFCSASEEVDDQYRRFAEEVGRCIGDRGWTLVTGGQSASMMGAVADGARTVGGRTIGVIPASLLHKADPNSHELVRVSSISERKETMIARADAILALPGGVGTCDEIFMSWTEVMAGPRRKPLVVLDDSGHYSELIMWIDRMVSCGFIGKEHRQAISVVERISDALDECGGIANRAA